MKKIIFLIALLNAFIAFSQDKQQLIDAIIKENRFDSEQIGGSGRISPVYANYQQLLKLVTDEELTELAKHKNAALRMYAILGLIARQNTVSLPVFFAQELKTGATVETMIGCIMDTDFTSSIVYHAYLFRDEHVGEKDSVQEKLDDIIVNSDAFVWWLLYDKVFSQRGKLNENLLQRIEMLAFGDNNSFAFYYLIRNYPEQYKQRAEDYLLHTFPGQKFDKSEEYNKDNDEVFISDFIDFLFESGRKDYREIAIAKMRDNKWLRDRDMWFDNTLKKYNVEL